MKKLILLILGLCAFIPLFAQQKPLDFTHQIKKIKGDLNIDGIADLVLVMQDTVAETAPYRLQIFFGQAKGSKKLMVTANKFIEAQYPNGKDGYRSGSGLGDISIKNGVLIIGGQLIRGTFSHKFRYQNGNFELIGYNYYAADGHGLINSDDFNLSTGMRVEKTISMETDKTISQSKTKKLIRPLPKLQNFVPFTDDL